MAQVKKWTYKRKKENIVIATGREEKRVKCMLKNEYKHLEITYEMSKNVISHVHYQVPKH